MRRLVRPALSPATQRTLEARTNKISQSPHPVEEARRLWTQKRVQAFHEIEATLKQMAPGSGDDIAFCMYCEGDTGTDIDHFWPKSLCPCRAFVWDNYLWSCSACNSNYKRTQFPLDNNQPLLIDPTVDVPQDHLILTFVEDQAPFFPTTPKGRCTIDVLKLNDSSRSKRRMDAFCGLQAHIILYDEALTQNDSKQAGRYRDCISRAPFGFVIRWLLQVSANTRQHDCINPACRAALARRPEIQTW